jgi:hypothetical protein
MIVNGGHHCCTYIQPRDRLRKHSTSGRSHQRFREFFVRNLPECWTIRLSSKPFPASVDADFDSTLIVPSIPQRMLG